MKNMNDNEIKEKYLKIKTFEINRNLNIRKELREELINIYTYTNEHLKNSDFISIIITFPYCLILAIVSLIGELGIKYINWEIKKTINKEYK